MTPALAFAWLPPEFKADLLGWVLATFAPAKTPWKAMGSYGAKHLFERARRRYVTNAQFSGAMLAAGFKLAPTETRSFDLYVRPRSRGRLFELPRRGP